MNFWYLAEPKFGGWVSFTAHLWHEWKLLTKTKPHLATIGRQPGKIKDFGYAVPLFVETKPDPRAQHLITAVDKHFHEDLALFPDGTFIVIHDPTELKEPVLRHLPRFQVITIRAAVKNHLQEKHGITSVHLKHPFHQAPKLRKECAPADRRGAVSCSRIDFDKNIDLLLKGNALLPEDEKILMYGALNSMCVHFKGLKLLGFDQYYKGGFEKDFFAVEQLLGTSKFLVDLSTIKNDGAGTQYTFLEAIYHGAVLILNAGWFKTGQFEALIPGANCLTVGSATALANNVGRLYPEDMAANAKRILMEHSGAPWVALLRQKTT